LLAASVFALESRKQKEMDVRSEIVAQFKLAAQGQDRRLAPLTGSLELLNSVLGSFCFASIVARLEGLLGLDPFSTSEDGRFPVTFAELIQVHEQAAQ
jgi:hypothetical protein